MKYERSYILFMIAESCSAAVFKHTSASIQRYNLCDK